MRQIDTEVLVIGGGATGTGVARDLAMRGFKTVLVERRDLSHGTTGRYHGLLHSGGRYVVKDPQAARECIAENQILRRIMPFCLEDTGGFFVVTPWDDPEYAGKFLAGCQSAGIPVSEITNGMMLRSEPLLNPRISHCFHVPDASADSFLASEANAESARMYAAQILNYHEVIRLSLSDDRSTKGQKVTGALCTDLVKDEPVQISADLVVNAAGAWSGKIAGTANIPLKILPGKGVMVAINHRAVNTVINRCKVPSDGDIIVPIHTVAVIGTTDEQVADPDSLGIEPWEIRLMLDEGEKLLPNLREMRMLRVWAGVRPLYKETDKEQTSQTEDSRDISRAYVLLDHETRDGIPGILTITSGKWTTYRLMAQATSDLVCKKLQVDRPCRTADEMLPEPAFLHPESAKFITTIPGSRPKPGAKGRSPHYHTLGARLRQIETDQEYDSPICECELATYRDIVQSITAGEARTLDDIRRDARLGMGPCQGGFCTFRAAGILDQLRQPPVEEINVALRDFLQERWKGLLPVLWGQQLRQERLDELIYLSVLNADHLPGASASRFEAEMYIPNPDVATREKVEKAQTAIEAHAVSTTLPIDVLVIGAGLSGLTAAWRAAVRGKNTRLITKGWGSTYWHAGCIDLLGYQPDSSSADGRSWVESPANGIAHLIESNPQHPYALAGLDGIADCLDGFKLLADHSGYPFHGSLEHNWKLPTACGAIRPTCLAPETMVAGDLERREPLLLVGFDEYRDFYPGWIARNLAAQGILAEATTLDITDLLDRRYVYTITLARLFDQPEFRDKVIQALKPKLGAAARLGFPAVLGLEHPMEVKRDLESQLGREIFEIPTLPPSIPGIRLHNLLVIAIETAGGQVNNGIQVVAGQVEDGKSDRIDVVWSEAAARELKHKAAHYILATGGILGGGFVTNDQGDANEAIFDLPLAGMEPSTSWFDQKFLAPAGHSIYRVGINVNERFQPLDPDGRPVYQNVSAVGGMLGQSDYLRERSLDGVALVTGFLAGEQAAGMS